MLNHLLIYWPFKSLNISLSPQERDKTLHTDKHVLHDIA